MQTVDVYSGHFSFWKFSSSQFFEEFSVDGSVQSTAKHISNFVCNRNCLRDVLSLSLSFFFYFSTLHIVILFALHRGFIVRLFTLFNSVVHTYALFHFRFLSRSIALSAGHTVRLLLLLHIHINTNVWKYIHSYIKTHNATDSNVNKMRDREKRKE